MPVMEPHCDLSTIDFQTLLADREAIRLLLPHRHEMEMISGVVRIEPENQLIVGYKDVSDQEFWARGHFPGRPLLPGVLMCEAAAQLAAFYTHHLKISEGVLMGLGGIEETRFRRAVVPGERLVLVGKGLRIKQRMTLFNVQGFVGSEMAFHTNVIGVNLGKIEES